MNDRTELLSGNKLAEKLDFIRDVGKQVLHYEHSEKESCCSLMPLALVLIEAAKLYSLFFNPSDSSTFRDLFDGGQENMPNLDTRLNTIRDLCSASRYGLIWRAERSPDLGLQSQPHEPSNTPGEAFWVELLEPYAEPGEYKDLVEAARLIDDVLEAILDIGKNLKEIFDGGNLGSWNEIARHADHIRDHFDYAEESLISIMKPA